MDYVRSQETWTHTRHSRKPVREEQKEFLDRFPPAEPCRSHGDGDESADDADRSARCFPILYAYNVEASLAVERVRLLLQGRRLIKRIVPKILDGRGRVSLGSVHDFLMTAGSCVFMGGVKFASRKFCLSGDCAGGEHNGSLLQLVASSPGTVIG